MATAIQQDFSTGLDGAVLTPHADGHGLPLFIQPERRELQNAPEAARAWFIEQKDAIQALLDDTGALVFRGFPVRDSVSFGRMVEHFGTPFGYKGGQSPREQLAPIVFEATRTPPDQRIALHQEMAYMPTFPKRLAFYCHFPSVAGGETILGDLRRVTAAIDQDLIAQIDRLGVLYTRVLRDGRQPGDSAYFDVVQRPWQDAFSTEDRDEAAAGARALGLDPEWLDDGSLAVRYRGPGLLPHPRTGEKLWFNQLQTLNLGHHNTTNFHLYEAQYDQRGKPRPFAATLGDGTPLTAAQAQGIADAMSRCAVAFPWSGGDMLLIDNYRAAHGRNAFTGLRNVQVALFG